MLQFILLLVSFLFFFNDTATTEIYTLSLHDALPISTGPTPASTSTAVCTSASMPCALYSSDPKRNKRSEEHTSELQSQSNLVCRLLLEKKKTQRHSADARTGSILS